MEKKNKENPIPGDFRIGVNGTSYLLPRFYVEKEKGLVYESDELIVFVRGSKNSDEDIASYTGITHESLLEMMIHDLKYKNSLVLSRETSQTITKLEEALLWQQRRGQIRAKEGKQGTYQK